MEFVLRNPSLLPANPLSRWLANSLKACFPLSVSCSNLEHRAKTFVGRGAFFPRACIRSKQSADCADLRLANRLGKGLSNEGST
jgi:hypothetical protein